MKASARLLLSTGFIGLLAAVSLLLLNSEGASGKDLARWYLGEMRRSEALQQRSQEVSQMMEVKSAVVKDLMAERVTLREAAEQFSATAEIVEDGNDDLVTAYRMPKTEAGLCRQVLTWVHSELAMHGDSEEAKEISCRLENEFAEQFPSAETETIEELTE